MSLNTTPTPSKVGKRIAAAGTLGADDPLPRRAALRTLVMVVDDNILCLILRSSDSISIDGGDDDWCPVQVAFAGKLMSAAELMRASLVRWLGI